VLRLKSALHNLGLASSQAVDMQNILKVFLWGCFFESGNENGTKKNLKNEG
jgi:hypothetical protein